MKHFLQNSNIIHFDDFNGPPWIEEAQEIQIAIRKKILETVLVLSLLKAGFI